jgi:hypothetical protein
MSMKTHSYPLKTEMLNQRSPNWSRMPMWLRITATLHRLLQRELAGLCSHFHLNGIGIHFLFDFPDTGDNYSDTETDRSADANAGIAESSITEAKEKMVKIHHNQTAVRTASMPEMTQQR